jgi:hypothetical protein
MSTTAGAPTVPETPPADGQWRPKIVALVCNWCTYTGADMAGTSRRTYADAVLLDGHFTGHPTQALDAACTLYLADTGDHS